MSECMTCHSPQAGDALSFRTRQLNRQGSLGGLSGNLLNLLADTGYLTGLTATPAELQRHIAPDESAYSLETRARSYLAVNCAYCPNDEGTVPAAWDASAWLPLFNTGMVNGSLNGPLHPDDRLLVPGHPGRSAILSRTAATNGYSRMPPIATHIIDSEGIGLIEAWIRDELPNRQSFSDWVAENLTDRPPADQAPDADPDADGRTNRQEFLAHTRPLVADPPPAPAVQSLTAGLLRLTFPSLPGRGVFVEHSADLNTWQPWPGYENQGTEPAPGNPLTLDVPIGSGPGFFRARIQER